jgi:tetratricopeptide (TPR) repeat protein
LSLSRENYLKDFRDNLKGALQSSEIKRTIAEVSSDTLSSLSLSKAAEGAGSQLSSFGIGIGLTMLGQYLATKKRGSRSARVIARILGANVDQINRDFVLANLRNKEYFKTIREKILDVIETKSIDEFAANLDLSSAEAWEVYRQIKEMIMDSEIITMIMQLSKTTIGLEELVSTKLQTIRNALDEQLERETKLHENLESELYQSHGLKLLSYDYFDIYKSSKQDFEFWEKGFPFKMESIRDNLELRRARVINDIEDRLERTGQLLLVGEKGLSKTTIFYEIICDYYDKGYEILYNEGYEIKDPSGVQRFIEKKMLEGKRKILVCIDNTHIPKVSEVFYVIDRIANHELRKNVLFLLTARIPEFDQLLSPDRIIQLEEPYRKSLKKITSINEFRYPLPYFNQDEIKEFYKRYSSSAMHMSEEEVNNKVQEIYWDTNKGHPVLVKFLVLGKGLSQHAEDMCTDHLMYNTNRLEAMLACGLFEIANVKITIELLDKMNILAYAEDLEKAALLRQESKGLWKTLHPAWDVELLSFLYNNEKGEELQKRKHHLKNAIDSIFKIEDEKTTDTEDRTYAVIGTIYNIAADRIIPLEIVESVTFPLPEYLTKENKCKIYGLFIAATYNDLKRYQDAINACSVAIELDPAQSWVWTNKGMILANLSKYDEAIECYDKAIELDPTNDTAYHNKSISLVQLGNYQEAIKYSNKTIELEPLSYTAWLMRGLALSRLGRYDEAIRCYDKAIEMKPDYVDAYCMKGESLDSMSKHDEAIRCYDKAIEINPKYAEAWNKKGFSLTFLEKYDEAITAIDNSIAINNNYALAWYGKGIILDTINKYDEAIGCFDKAIELDPNNALAYENKGLALSQLKRYDEAIRCYDKAIELDPNYSSYVSKADILHSLESYDEAINECNKAIVISGDNAEAWRLKAGALHNLDKYEEAIKCYDKAIELEPNDADAWILKAYALTQFEKYKECLDFLHKYLGLEPDDAYAWNLKGLNLYNLDKYEEAIKCYDKAIKLSPNDADPWHNKGNALYNLDKYEEAIKCYDKAIKLSPNDADPWYNKGLALYDLGNNEEAIVCYDKVIEMEPNYLRAWHNKGNALYNLDKYEEAIKCYDKAIKVEPKNVQAYYLKGLSFFYIEKYKEAIKCYDKALAIEPDAEVWKEKGHSFGHLIRYKESIECYDKALEIEPNSSDTWYKKGYVLYVLGKYEEAIKCYDKALEIEPDFASAWYNRARSKVQMGNIESSLSDLEKAVGIDKSLIELARQDQDFKSVRNHERFIALTMKRKRRKIPAVKRKNKSL